MIAGHHSALACKALPYDADVQYIESDGTQYVDTGLAVSALSAVSIDIEFSAASMSSTGFIGSSARSGSTTAQKERFYGSATISGGAVSAGYVDFGNVTNSRVTLTAISSGARVTLAKHDINIASTALTDAANAFVFCASTSAGIAPSAKVAARLFACSFWVGDVLVRDYVPVRVGTTGEIYDKVSKSFATRVGEFVCGPDK